MNCRNQNHQNKSIYMTASADSDGNIWWSSCIRTHSFIIEKLTKVPNSIIYQVECTAPNTSQSEFQQIIIAELLKNDSSQTYSSSI